MGRAGRPAPSALGVHVSPNAVRRMSRMGATLVTFCSVVIACSWTFSGRSFLVDLLINFQAQLILLMIFLAICFGVLRLRCHACVLATGCVVGIFPVLQGRPVSAPISGPRSQATAGQIRVVSLNIHPENSAWREEIDAALIHNPDVLVLIETSYEMWRWLRGGGMRSSTLPYWAHRDWVDDMASPCVVLSRWPIQKLDFPAVVNAERDILLCRVEHPVSPFVTGAIHPHSPRDSGRWRLGNEQLISTTRAITECRSERGMPLIVGTDLNASPAGSRARRLRQAGLFMSKPWSGGWGSFPALFPGIARLQLDDVWRSSDVKVLSWDSLEPIGSDHRMIVADFSVGTVSSPSR